MKLHLSRDEVMEAVVQYLERRSRVPAGVHRHYKVSFALEQCEDASWALEGAQIVLTEKKDVGTGDDPR